MNSSESNTSVTVTLCKSQSPVLVTVMLNATVSLTIMKSVAFKLTFTTVMLGLYTVTLAVSLVSLVTLDLAVTLLTNVPLVKALK